MKLFSGFRSAGTIANPSANQCATLPFTFQSSRTRECAPVWQCGSSSHLLPRAWCSRRTARWTCPSTSPARLQYR